MEDDSEKHAATIALLGSKFKLMRLCGGRPQSRAKLWGWK